MHRSRRIATAVLSGALALSGTVLATPAAAAPAADTPVAVTQLSKTRPTEIQYVWAGASGFQYWYPNSGSGATSWLDHPGVTPPDQAGPEDLATGVDVTNSRSAGGATVSQRHRSVGTTATVTIPAGQTYKAAVGWSVLTVENADPTALHVLRAAPDGTTADLPVTGLPAGAELTGTVVTGGSVRRLAVVYKVDTTVSTGLVDLADGTFGASVPGSDNVQFNDRWFVVGNKFLKADAAPGTTATKIVGSYFGRPLAVVGEQVLTGLADFLPAGDTPKLQAVSLTTGTTRTLLDNSYGSIAPTLDGGALATAGPSSTDWHVHRVTATADGDASASPVLTVPAGYAPVDGLMLSGGELLMHGNPTLSIAGVYAMPLDAAGKPTGPQVRRSTDVNVSPCLAGDAACPQYEALGDGRFAYLSTSPDSDQESVNVAGLSPNSYAYAAMDDSAGRVGAGSGRYVLYNGNTQKVADFARGANGEIVLSRSRTAAAIWGQRLWTPGATQGSVVAYDLKAKRTVATVETGAPCTPNEIQAVNAWLYWSCGASGPAGVYDRAAGRAITVPAGQARLADGFLIRENRTTHELLLTDFHTGTATTRTVAVLPAADQDGGGNTGRWTVDRFGGNIAYRKERGQIALVTAGVPTSPLAQMEAQTDPQPGPTVAEPWRPVWQLNKPSTWTLTLSNASGTVVRTLTGTSTAAAVRPSWDATTTSGARAPRGAYTWKLTAEPRDGQGPGLTLSGTTTVD
ncbi:FlgD immunoglobulin-like domain containing protein [Streptomyces sp. NPDC002888]|uniref:FlgD immunoglobulin-like domain containing protein n=1 Tax=Streptomyces sp. NPDC002888 TaxID=3364668 RepID=UPI0036A9DBCE